MDAELNDSLSANSLFFDNNIKQLQFLLSVADAASRILRIPRAPADAPHDVPVALARHTEDAALARQALDAGRSARTVINAVASGRRQSRFVQEFSCCRG